VRLGQAEFPRAARMLDRRERRGARATIVTGDQNHVRMGLRHAGGDRAHADLGDQLDAHACLAVGILQVMDQLRQILDGVDVMVRRGRDETDARRGARTLAMADKTFLPGNSPPSPGFAPWAILIWSSFALTR